jgi:hypothetical protein
VKGRQLWGRVTLRPISACVAWFEETSTPSTATSEDSSSSIVANVGQPYLPHQRSIGEAIALTHSTRPDRAPAAAALDSSVGKGVALCAEPVERVER